MVDRGAATAADQVDAVFRDEAFQPGREFSGAERIVRVAIDEFRQAGVGLHREQPGPVGGEPADVFGHFLRAGAAVQADQRHVQRMNTAAAAAMSGPTSSVPVVSTVT